MTELARIFGISLLTVTAVIIGSMLPVKDSMRIYTQYIYRRKLDNLLDKTMKQISMLTIQTRLIESELDEELRINEDLLKDLKELRARINELEESQVKISRSTTNIER